MAILKEEIETIRMKNIEEENKKREEKKNALIHITKGIEVIIDTVLVSMERKQRSINYEEDGAMFSFDRGEEGIFYRVPAQELCEKKNVVIEDQYLIFQLLKDKYRKAGWEVRESPEENSLDGQSKIRLVLS